MAISGSFYGCEK